MNYGEKHLKFVKRIKSNVKEYREALGLTQQELADKVGVSRQTIYYLEKGDYNPSLTLSFKLTEILEKPLELIFYQDPIIKDILEGKSLADLREVAKVAGINLEKLASLSEIDDEMLTSSFNYNLLVKIARGLGMKFEDLFEKEAEN
ncbi:MAG: helix-turn-helix transcriptional regulator [Promethearchaeota archaeon]|nr:MAG: helix-turn-helix transcriptional regulator [Candidatus Lokiarchaeota archaeon]